MNESSLNPMLDNLRNANDRYNCNKLDRRKTRFHFDFNPLFQFIFSLFFVPLVLSFPAYRLFLISFHFLAAACNDRDLLATLERFLHVFPYRCPSLRSPGNIVLLT